MPDKEKAQDMPQVIEQYAAYAGETSFYIKFNWPFLGAGVVFSGLGKERGGCGRGIFQVWLKNS
jgi:hypothetical protein